MNRKKTVYELSEHNIPVYLVVSFIFLMLAFSILTLLIGDIRDLPVSSRYIDSQADQPY